MQELLPDEVKVSPESLDAYLSLDLGPLYTPDAAVFREILTAQRLRRRAVVRYRSLSSNRTTNRRIHPYHVLNLRGDWYVAAWDEVRQAVRDFAIHRMRRVTITTESYEVPRGLAIRRHVPALLSEPTPPAAVAYPDWFPPARSEDAIRAALKDSGKRKTWGRG